MPDIVWAPPSGQSIPTHPSTTQIAERHPIRLSKLTRLEPVPSRNCIEPKGPQPVQNPSGKRLAALKFDAGIMVNVSHPWEGVAAPTIINHPCSTLGFKELGHGIPRQRCRAVHQVEAILQHWQNLRNRRKGHFCGALGSRVNQVIGWVSQITRQVCLGVQITNRRKAV